MTTFTEVGRVLLSLAVVLALLWVAARVLRRGQRRTQHGVVVDVLARQPLAQRASVAVVKVGDRALVLGVTESRVELLADQPMSALVDAAALPSDLDPSRALLTVDDAPALSLPSAGGAGAPVTSLPTRSARRSDAAPQGPLAGSALSPATWAKALDVVREKTVRR